MPHPSGHSPNASFNQMARAWATARLLKRGEQITEQNIRRLLAEKEPVVPRQTKLPGGGPIALFDSPGPPAPIPKKEAEVPAGREEILYLRETLSRYREREQAYRSKISSLESSLREENAKRQVLHNQSAGSLSEEEVARRLSEARAAWQQKLLELEQRERTANHSLKEVEKQLTDAQARYRHQEQIYQREVAALETKLREENANLEILREKFTGSLSEKEAVRRLREVEAEWKQKFFDLEQREQAVVNTLDEVRRELANQSRVVAIQNAEKETFISQLNQKASEISSLEERLSSLSTENTKLRTNHQELGIELKQLRSLLEEKETELLEARRMLDEGNQGAEAGSLVLSREDRSELDRLRSLVRELSGFENDPGIECRKVLVETLENELTLCLQREAAMLARVGELDSEGTQGDNLSAERKRLGESTAYLRHRIDSLGRLIAESLAFLRRKESEENQLSDDQESDDQ